MQKFTINCRVKIKEIAKMKKCFFNFAKIYLEEDLNLYCDNKPTPDKAWECKKYIDPDDIFYNYLTLIKLKNPAIYLQRKTGKLMIKLTWVTGHYTKTSSQYPGTSPVEIYESEELYQQCLAADIKYPFAWARKRRLEEAEEAKKSAIRGYLWSNFEDPIANKKFQIKQLQKEVADLETKFIIEKQKVSCNA